jgi:hypothetical protein
VREEELGLNLSAYQKGAIARAAAGAYGDYVGNQLETAKTNLYKNVGKPVMGALRGVEDFGRGLVGLPAAGDKPLGAEYIGKYEQAPTPAPRPAPAPAGSTPETTRPNRPAPAPAPAPARTGPDTTKFPYGVDLKRLLSMFPQASSVPAAVKNGLAVREQQEMQRLAPIMQALQPPSAPRRGSDKDLTKQTSNILDSLRGVRTGSGGFGDLMRYRLALGFANRDLIPLAMERADRERQYESAKAAYDAEQDLGLKMRDLQLGYDKLAQRALEHEQDYGLQRFGSQWDVVKGLMTLQQNEQAAWAKAAKDARDAAKLYGFDYLDPVTQQILKGQGVYLGLDPSGSPVTRQLSGPIKDPYAGPKQTKDRFAETY